MPAKWQCCMRCNILMQCTSCGSAPGKVAGAHAAAPGRKTHEPLAPAPHCAGVANDEYFQYARAGRVRFPVGSATRVDGAGVHLAGGTVLPANVVVYSGSYEFQGAPPCLAELGLGGFQG